LVQIRTLLEPYIDMFWFLDTETTLTLNYFVDNFLVVQVLVLPLFPILRRFLTAGTLAECVGPIIFMGCGVYINIVFWHIIFALWIFYILEFLFLLKVYFIFKRYYILDNSKKKSVKFFWFLDYMCGWVIPIVLYVISLKLFWFCLVFFA